MLECINPATAPRIATFPLLSHLSPLSPPLSDRAHTRKSRRRPSPLSSLSRTPASPQITPPATPHPDRGSPPPSCYRAAPYQKIQGRQNRSLNRRPTSPPCPPPARGALLQPENTVAPEKVPLWHCSRSARWYAFRVFFFWGGGKKVEAKIQFTLDNHAVEWVLISSSCYSVRNLLMFVQFLELISWYSLQLMNASLFLELIS